MEKNETIMICPECHGEYYSTIKLCPKCNVALIHEVETTSRTSSGLSPSLKKSILFSILGIVLYLLGFFIRIPGLNHAVVHEFFYAHNLRFFCQPS